MAVELITSRLRLRPLVLSDVVAFHSYRSDAVTNRYQGWIPARLEDSEQFINNRVSPVMNMNGTWFQFVIILKASGRIIGDIGLHFIDGENSHVELGCTLDKVHQGNGYATEALTEVIGFLFGTLGKKKLIARIDPENAKSIRVFEHLGFRKESLPGETGGQEGIPARDLIFTLAGEETAPSGRQ
jgi:RimJ/RimL family protein N-acetyltransferase